jgi:hypothetical protein
MGQSWGAFRFRGDSRNHRAIVQPRLYDRSMVARVTLYTELEPHKFDSCWPGTLIRKSCHHQMIGRLIRSPWPYKQSASAYYSLTSRCVRARPTSLKPE